ncbi:MAG: sigma-70 family RNA polymerase sigma factor [Verrucomicrobiales bacterium]|nr:sigma-70 family RNA polymerase sigma factor [Verrucomicrobiales bacterium]
MNADREPSSGAGVPGDATFATTRWSVVLAAGHPSSATAGKALAELCQAYWYPLYAYVRRRGRSREDAEDLVQSFFGDLLERNPFGSLSAERGRFRAFLLAALKHSLANDWDRAHRQKRGGGVAPLSLDWNEAEARFHREPADLDSPDRAYDRAWAVALLEHVVVRLEEECTADGRGALFRVTRGFLMLGEEAIPHAQAARELGMDEGAVRIAVHRLRKRYRELLREEISQTLQNPAQTADELRSLQAALMA